MAKARILKTQEEISRVPENEPVQIELDAENPSEDAGNKEIEVKKIEDTPQKSGNVDGKPKPAAKKKSEPTDESIIALQKQLDDLKRAEELARQQATESERQRLEALKTIEEREKGLTDLDSRANQAEYDSVLNAMAAAQAEAESAQRDLETAVNNQDAKLQADAQRRIARSESRLVQLEDGKANLEARREQAKTARAEALARPQQLTIDQHIDGLPNLLPAERVWLKAHQDVLVDIRKNTRLQAAHLDAEDTGHPRGTEAYFKFIEEKLGYRKPEPVIDNDDNDEEGTPIVAAPVSRETPSAGSGRPATNRITLTPEQREMARLSGISEIEYARQLLKLQELKKNGHYVDR